jgi:Tat protein secretion system quality control protein TatD with DNase activity
MNKPFLLHTRKTSTHLYVAHMRCQREVRKCTLHALTPHTQAAQIHNAHVKVGIWIALFGRL